ncbi:MAG: pyridoxal kinase PdxY [Treponema sp.]|nr:pyridoxal kinase PdxY [Treponema sp.]
MAILSIQSHVVYGYAGNTAAVFPLQRLGREVWAVNTVEFSNHTGYGAWRGSVLGSSLASELVAGLADRGVLGNCEAVLSGYMGDPEVGLTVVQAVRQVKSLSPRAVYCCDPVMGDTGRGFYVKEGILEMFKTQVVPQADILTPNQFELEALTGLNTSSLPEALRALERLHDMGPRALLVTSFIEDQAPKRHIDMLASNGDSVYRIRTPEFPFETVMAGSGDLTAAVFLSRYLESANIQEALERTAGAVYGIMEATFMAKSREMLLVQAQDSLVRPALSFHAVKL